MTAESRTELAAERTQLAAERTHLANERTYLAYLRTSIAMIALGLGTVQFLRRGSAGTWGRAGLSLGLIAIGIVFAAIAERRARHMRRVVHRQHPSHRHPGTTLTTALIVVAGLSAAVFVVAARA